MVLKCFGRKFVRSFRTKAANDSCGFGSILETKGPNSWKQNLKKKKRREKDVFRLFFWRVVMKKLFDYFWKQIIAFSKFFVETFTVFWSSTALSAWFRSVKTWKKLELFEKLHVFDLLLKYCSDIKEGIGIQLHFYFFRFVNIVASFTRKGIFHLWFKFQVGNLSHWTFIETSAFGFRNWFDHEGNDFGDFLLESASFCRLHICMDWNLHELIDCDWLFTTSDLLKI